MIAASSPSQHEVILARLDEAAALELRRGCDRFMLSVCLVATAVSVLAELDEYGVVPVVLAERLTRLVEQLDPDA